MLVRFGSGTTAGDGGTVGKSKIAMNCGVAAKALQLEPVVVRGAKTTVEPQIKGIRVVLSTDRGFSERFRTLKLE